jgi:hypothetical protein
MGGDLTGRQLAVPEGVEDLATRRVGQRSEDSVRGRRVYIISNIAI